MCKTSGTLHVGAGSRMHSQHPFAPRRSSASGARRRLRRMTRRSRRPASRSAPRGSRARGRAARASRQPRPRREPVCMCRDQRVLRSAVRPWFRPGPCDFLHGCCQESPAARGCLTQLQEVWVCKSAAAWYDAAKSCLLSAMPGLRSVAFLCPVMKPRHDIVACLSNCIRPCKKRTGVERNSH